MRSLVPPFVIATPVRTLVWQSRMLYGIGAKGISVGADAHIGPKSTDFQRLPLHFPVPFIGFGPMWASAPTRE